MLKINEELRKLIPPLTEDEYELLEKSILSEKNIREKLIVWNNVIIDGHNRYEIAQRHGIKYDIIEKQFNSIEDAMIWIIDNQKGRRNLTDGWKIELGLKRKDLLIEKGKQIKKQSGKEARSKQLGVLSTVDKTPNIIKLSMFPGNTDDSDDIYNNSKVDDIKDETEFIKKSKHNTRKEISESIGIKQTTLARAEIVRKKNPEIWEKVKQGEETVGGAYKKIKQEEKKEVFEKKHIELKKKELEPITLDYDVIVIDPPWQMEKIERDVAPNQVSFDYPTMTIEEIKQFKLPAASDCHVFMWITQKYLPMGFDIFKEWGTKYVCSFVWHKNGGFQPFNLPQYNCEFVLYGRIGSPSFYDLKDFKLCFHAERKEHSVKPDEFYDLIRRVTSGKRIDIFNRRKIDGFDTWGNESC